jgi:integrase/recombinase XerD
MAQSCKLCIRKDRNKRSGLAPLYLQVLIDSKKTTLSLELKWDPEFFDEDKGRLLKRSKKDPDIEDYEMIIQTTMAKVNEIFKWYRLAGQPLTMEKFKDEMNSFTSKTDFIAFFEKKLNDRRYKEKVIEEQTYRNHRAVLRKLRQFSPKLRFVDITPEFLNRYKAYLRDELKNAKATIWGNFKDIKTYFHLAKSAGITALDPFENFEAPEGESKPTPLSQQELAMLMREYYNPQITRSEKQVLKYFLFACCGGGLRISDLIRSTKENLVGEVLIFQPYKTRKKGKTLYVPLNDLALRFLKDNWDDNTSHQLFQVVTGQGSNRILKRIAERLGIKKNITNHVARDTFASIFLELGGSIEVLQRILGHSKISTTMKYVDVSAERKQQQMQSFNQLAVTVEAESI